MKNRRSSCLLPCLLLAGMVSGAQAQSTAYVHADGLHFTLTDLDLNDGITPSLIWVDTLSESAIDLGIQHGADHGTPIYIDTFKDTDTHLQGLGASTSVETSGIKASTSSSALSIEMSIPLGASVYSYATTGGHFQLSAHTEVTFSTSVSTQTTGMVPPSAPEPNGYFDWAYYSTFATASLEAGGVTNVANVTSSIRADAIGHTGFDADSGILSHTFTNTADAVMNDRAVLRLSVDSLTVTPPVPEPGVVLQFAIGMAGMGVVAWRRRRDAKPARSAQA